MKILFAGLGSIGTRHIKNLHALLCERGITHEIDALRGSDAPLRDGVAPLLRRSFHSISELDEHYDLAFVTNPTALHEQTVRQLAPFADHFFIEKPVFSDLSVEVETLGLRPDSVCYVACPLRHTPVLRRAKQLCEQEPVRAARAICSSYLPDWRPGTDYRQCYSARRALGGGVVLDLIHEWDYLSWLFGLPEAVSGFAGKYSALEIDSDDLAVYIAKYPGLLVTLHLDYLGRAPVRELGLFCDGEPYRADLLAGTVQHLKSGELEQFAPEDFYLNEMNYFLDCVLDRVCGNMNTPAHALEVLRTAALRPFAAQP